METIEYTFGKGFDMKKALHAMMEEDEDVVLGADGQTLSELERTLSEDEPCVSGVAV